MLEKLRNALMEIKSECSQHKTSCLGCPLLTDGSGYTHCGVVGIDMNQIGAYKKKPKYWELPDIRLMSATKYDKEGQP